MCFSTGPSQKVKSGPVSICHTHATKANFNSLVNKEKQMKSTTKAFIPHEISNGKSDATSVRRAPSPLPSTHLPSPFPPFFYSFFSAAGRWQLRMSSPHFLLVAEVAYLTPQPRGICPCLGKSQLHIRPLWRAGWSAANSVGISTASLLSRDLV